MDDYYCALQSCLTTPNPQLDPYAVSNNFASINSSHNYLAATVSELSDRVGRLEELIAWVEQTHPEVIHAYKCTKAATNKILGEGDGAT